MVSYSVWLGVYDFINISASDDMQVYLDDISSTPEKKNKWIKDVAKHLVNAWAVLRRERSGDTEDSVIAKIIKSDDGNDVMNLESFLERNFQEISEGVKEMHES